jgi:thiol-disulfide isomerase/thioredoxin
MRILALPIAALAAALSLGPALRAADALPAMAPAWSLTDLDGKPVTSAQLKGKVVILDFWATWCVPCRTEIPGYIALQRKYGADGLAIVGVSVDTEGLAVVRKFVKDMGINYTVVMVDDDILRSFNPAGYPTTYIIDRDGLIRFRKLGRMPAADFEKRVLAVLKPAPR